MTRISVYDTVADKIERICDDYGISEAELTEAMMDIIESDEINLSEWI